MSTAKKPDLVVQCDGMTYQMDEVGAWSWQKGENGSITLTASPPGVEPPTATNAARQARQARRGGGVDAELGKKLVGVLSPTLQAKAAELKANAAASMEAAKQQAAAETAAAEAATPTRGAPPEAEQE